MESVPTVYIVNSEAVANSLTKQLLTTVNIFSRDFMSPGELLSQSSFFSPACFLLSFLLPEMSGLELMLRLRKRGVVHPCIFTSTQIEPELIVRAMQSGGFDFIKKPFQAMDFIELIQKALEYDQKVNRYLQIGLNYRKKYHTLSGREKAIVALILNELSATKIGDKLGISHRTVENHRNKIFTKLDIAKTSELIRIATIYETVSNMQFITDDPHDSE